MTDKERQALSEEWQRNEERLASLPVNSAERALLEVRQDEIEYALGMKHASGLHERSVPPPQWRVERWATEVFPGVTKTFSHYQDLPRRELAIVVSGVLDLALAELIACRLLDYPKEAAEFLGANEDGRAPAGSLGSRIQLALLLGLISPDTAAILRTLKNIRNKFAHRVNVDFTHRTVQPLMVSLQDKMHEQSEVLPPPWRKLTSQQREEQRAAITSNPEAAAAYILVVFMIYQTYFYRLSFMITRIEPLSLDKAKLPKLPWEGRPGGQDA